MSCCWRNRLELRQPGPAVRRRGRSGATTRSLDDESCYPEPGYPPFANFFLQNNFELARTKDDGDWVDYELPIFNYAIGR